MKKSNFFRGMFDGLRSTVSQPSSGSKGELEVDEPLKSAHFQVAKIVRHGFPHQPTALAFEPIQRLIAIGTKNGSLRILGRPGVDIHVQHITEYAVLDIKFIINEGQVITLCADDSLHLWSLRAKPPEIVHSLKFQKERITYCHLTFQSKWLYIGTERGNVHVVNIDSFMLSGYVINWNKAIELSRKTHPGSIVHISDCPIDTNKLLIGFESGSIVLWDLRNKNADFRQQYNECLKSISWHHEGRQFICSHSDGSLTTWNIRDASKPLSVVYPHSKHTSDDLKPELCKPIYKTEWKTVRNGDSYIIFSGGLPNNTPNELIPQPSSSSTSSSPIPKSDRLCGTQTLTVIHGKTTTVLEMEHNIVDFITLCESPYETDFNEPYAIVVLLHNDLVVVDLLSPGYPCFQNPYSMDLHESLVSFCYYIADCPTDLIPAFYSVGYKGAKRSGFSEKDWPINGGEWGISTLSYPEIIITGHADGSLKFWDASSVNLQVLYKLKTAKLFEKPRTLKANAESSQAEAISSNPQESDDPFAIEQIAFCTESRYLCVAGASSQLVVFRFSKHEAHTEVPVIEIAMNYDMEADHESDDLEVSSGVGSLLAQRSNDSHDSNSGAFYLLQVKSGHHKRVPGFQPEFVCLSPYIDRTTPPFRITSLSVNSYAGLVAYGCENGLVIIDMIQKCAVLNVPTADLYGTPGDRQKAGTPFEGYGVGFDSYQRMPRPAKKVTSTSVTSSKDNASEANQSEAEHSFSRSRSSSASSLENVCTEAVQYMTFADTYCSKSDATTGPCLWVGTSLGSILVISLTLPDSTDNRVLCLQTVIASPSGNIYRLKGVVLCIAFLDYSGTLLQLNFEKWKDSNRADNTTPSSSSSMENKRSSSLTISRSGSGVNSASNRNAKISPTSSSTDMRDSHFAVMVSEKKICIVNLPSQMCSYKATLTETSFAVRADVVYMKSADSVCLAVYLGTGNIVVYSLPSLRLLIDIDFLPLTDVRIARTITFSANGHGIYLSSPSELTKFTISSSFRDNIPDMMGNLFIPKELPEAPKPSFLKGLFGGGPSLLDREELFGETSSGKPSKTTARHIQGAVGNVDQVKRQSGSLGSEMARLREGFTERGERLSQIEDRTARMQSEAEAFHNLSHNVMLKYRDKKWYQF